MSLSPEFYIPHSTNNSREAQAAFESGSQIIEVDVAKQAFTRRFVVQHHGVLGKLGVGQKLETFLDKIGTESGLLLDLKHPQYSHAFAEDLAEVLIERKIAARICGDHWEAVSAVCQVAKQTPYYSLNSPRDIVRFRTERPNLQEPEGFTVPHQLINEGFMEEVGSELKVLAWGIHRQDDVTPRRLERLGVAGVIVNRG